jgi:hypothetical protein
MAHVRVILMLAALGACGQAGADGSAKASPPAGKVPAGWKSLPALGTAAQKAAAAEGVTVEGGEAWGDPAMGCYAVWLALGNASGDAGAIARQVIDGLAAAKVETSEVSAPTGDEGVLALRFGQGNLKGRMKAKLGSGKIAALACFANQREPKSCEAACTTMLGAIE